MVEKVHPKQIESTLDSIWKSFQGTSKMRACLFNLIIYSKKCQRIEYLNQVIQEVIERFPSRIIFITYDETCSNYDLKTSVSLLTATEGKNEIACDLIEIDVCSKDHPRIPFVILPHILPDLPIYLVYADDPSKDNPIVKKLEHFATRVIFDSEATDHLPNFSKAVLKSYESGSIDVADLNWGRIEGWRQLFANMFKSPDEIETLRRAKQIDIYFNAKESNASCNSNIQSIYIQSWIATQLGWKLSKLVRDESLLTFTYQKEDQPIQISLHPLSKQGVRSGRILSIDIQIAHDHLYQIKRSPTCFHHVIIEKSNPELCSLPITFVFDKDISGQSLVKEICHKGTSQHYVNMLKKLATITSEYLCQ